MKSFIVNVYKNKKWITLGLSILYLLLFCFPIISIATSYNEITHEIRYSKFPFILSLPYQWKFIPNQLESLYKYGMYHTVSVKLEIATNLCCSILMFTCFILAIICLICLFKKKNFGFIWSLLFAFLTMLIAGIYLTYHSSKGIEKIEYKLEFYSTTYIFLALLVLDIVYLCLERHYVHGGQEKLATRKAARQAKQEAALKQSPEYRIEQLEKELQELKSQVKSDDDRQ